MEIWEVSKNFQQCSIILNNETFSDVLSLDQEIMSIKLWMHYINCIYYKYLYNVINAYTISTCLMNTYKNKAWLFKLLPWNPQWDMAAWVLLKQYAALLKLYYYASLIRVVLLPNSWNVPRNLKTSYKQSL